MALSTDITSSDRMIQIDPGTFRELQKTLSAFPKGIAKVMSRAVNKVATAARQEISVEVRKRVNVKAGELKRRNVTLKRATFKTQGATIKIRGGRIPLIKFSANQTQKGVTYKIGKVGPRKLAPSSFIAQMGSGHRGVFKRAKSEQDSNLKGTGAFVHQNEAGYDREQSSRLPIVELKGPSVPQVFSDIAKFAKAVHENTIATRLEKELATQVEVLLKQEIA